MSPAELLAAFEAMSDAEKDAVREGVGVLCLWCLRPADRLCDGPVFRERVSGGILEPYCRVHEHSDESTCSAPLCGACSISTEHRGHLDFSDGHGETFENTVDLCPCCAMFKASGRKREDWITREKHREAVRDHARAHRASSAFTSKAGQ